MICLDIPIPHCTQDLLQEPPICFPVEEDIKTLQLLRDFGEEFGCPTAEIEQACNLASGTSDLVVILERPHIRQTFTLPFHEFVRDCPTLYYVCLISISDPKDI